MSGCVAFSVSAIFSFHLSKHRPRSDLFIRSYILVIQDALIIFNSRKEENRSFPLRPSSEWYFMQNDQDFLLFLIRTTITPADTAIAIIYGSRVL